MDLERWYRGGIKIKLEAGEIFYKREGAGPVLICIHGFPSSSWDFELMWKGLMPHFDLITMDLIGLGRSEKTSAEISVKKQAQMIESLCEHLQVSSAHILSHDYGDTVAQELIASFQEGSLSFDLKSCVFLNGGLFPETHQPLLIQRLLASPLGPLLSGFISIRSLRKSFHRIFSDSKPPSEDFIQGTWDLIVENNGKAMIPKLIKYMDERRVNRERWVGVLEQPVIPMRLINGIEDPVSGLHAAVRYEELVPNADIVYLENTGHYPHVEDPEAVLAAFLEFHSIA